MDDSEFFEKALKAHQKQENSGKWLDAASRSARAAQVTSHKHQHVTRPTVRPAPVVATMTLLDRMHVASGHAAGHMRCEMMLLALDGSAWLERGDLMQALAGTRSWHSRGAVASWVGCMASCLARGKVIIRERGRGYGRSPLGAQGGAADMGAAALAWVTYWGRPTVAGHMTARGLRAGIDVAVSAGALPDDQAWILSASRLQAKLA